MTFGRAISHSPAARLTQRTEVIFEVHAPRVSLLPMLLSKRPVPPPGVCAAVTCVREANEEISLALDTAMLRGPVHTFTGTGAGANKVNEYYVAFLGAASEYAV